MDGTVSHIVRHPDMATITDCNCSLLATLGDELVAVGFITGRSVSAIMEKVGLPQLTYIGSHGLERWEENRVVVPYQVNAYRPNIDTVIDLCKEYLVEGIWIEDKITTISIHYRHVEDHRNVIEKLIPAIQSIAQDHGLRFSVGKMVFEIRAPLEIDKGIALRELVQKYQLDSVFYLGDDASDVDAMIAAKEIRTTNLCMAIGIGVQSPEMPLELRETADLLVDGVDGVEEFLQWVLNVKLRKID